MIGNSSEESWIRFPAGCSPGELFVHCVYIDDPGHPLGGYYRRNFTAIRRVNLRKYRSMGGYCGCDACRYNRAQLGIWLPGHVIPVPWRYY